MHAWMWQPPARSVVEQEKALIYPQMEAAKRPELKQVFELCCASECNVGLSKSLIQDSLAARGGLARWICTCVSV